MLSRGASKALRRRGQGFGRRGQLCRPVEGEGMSHADIQGKSIPGRENSRCKGPGARSVSCLFEYSTGASGAGGERRRREEEVKVVTGRRQTS